MPDSIITEREGAIVRLRLNRPEVRNALDQPAIAAITAAFTNFSKDESIRGIVLSGEGPAFCGGADINYMRSSLDWGEEKNEHEAFRLAHMFSAIDNCPIPVIAKVHGACLGAGVGLTAVSDIVIAADDALFGFTEAKLGIVPAVISPFVLRKIGQTHARALFSTAERFDAQRALRIGLVHEVVPASELDAAAQGKTNELLTSGPRAARLAKEIAKTVDRIAPADAPSWTARRIAERRASDEGQEGLRAFLEKRKPSWQ